MKRKIISEDKNLSEKYTSNNIISRKLIYDFYSEIKTLIESIKPENLLEVACGPGFSTQYLNKFFKKTIEASDVSVDLIKEAKRRNPRIKISQESIYNLKREDSSFDLIVVLEALEHLENPNKALSELKRVSNKYCLISVPREPIWRILNMFRGSYLKDLGNTPGHINHWSKKSFVDLVSRYFEIKKVKTPLPWTIVLAGK